MRLGYGYEWIWMSIVNFKIYIHFPLEEYYLKMKQDSRIQTYNLIKLSLVLSSHLAALYDIGGDPGLKGYEM